MRTRIPRTWYPVLGVAAILLVLLLAGCTGTNYGPAPVTTQATPATTSPPATPAATTIVTTVSVTPTTPATTLPSTTEPAMTTTAAPTPPPAVAVTIQNFAFSPPSVTVPVGTTVTWTNQDSAPHGSSAMRHRRSHWVPYLRAPRWNKARNSPSPLTTQVHMRTTAASTSL